MGASLRSVIEATKSAGQLEMGESEIGREVVLQNFAATSEEELPLFDGARPVVLLLISTSQVAMEFGMGIAGDTHLQRDHGLDRLSGGESDSAFQAIKATLIPGGGGFATNEVEAMEDVAGAGKIAGVGKEQTGISKVAGLQGRRRRSENLLGHSGGGRIIGLEEEDVAEKAAVEEMESAGGSRSGVDASGQGLDGGLELALVEVGDGEVEMAEFALGFRTASKEEKLFAGAGKVVKSEQGQPRAPRQVRRLQAATAGDFNSLKSLLGLVIASQEEGKTAVNRRGVGVELEGAAQLGDSRGQLIEVVVLASELEVGVGVVRVKANEAAQGLTSAVVIFPGLEVSGLNEQALTLADVLTKLEGSGYFTECLRILADNPAVVFAEAEMSHGELGIEIESGAEKRGSLVGLALSREVGRLGIELQSVEGMGGHLGKRAAVAADASEGFPEAGAHTGSESIHLGKKGRGIGGAAGLGEQEFVAHGVKSAEGDLKRAA